MPSSEPRKPNYSRRFLWLAIFIVVLFGGYSLAWYYAAGWVQDFAATQIANLNRDGRSADCANTTARGYPFRMGLFCDSVHLADPATQLTAAAGAFRSAAQVYDPFHIVAELDGPATISTAAASALAFDWKNLRASVRLNSDFPDRLD